MQAELSECGRNAAKLKSDAKNAEDITSETKRKEAQCLQEKRSLEAEVTLLKEQQAVKKQAAAGPVPPADEVSGNADDARIDGKAAAVAAAADANESPKAAAAGAAAVAAARAVAAAKTKDEVGAAVEQT